MPNEQFLDKGLARSLCTLIVLGYSILKQEEGTPANFQYHEEGDKDNYKKVVDLFKRHGVNITANMSRNKKNLPLIFADTGEVKGKSLTSDEHLDQLTKTYKEEIDLARKLDEDARPFKLEYPGAYIGGKSTPVDLRIIGPSGLKQYFPRYRKLDDGQTQEIRKAYGRAKEAFLNLTNFLIGEMGDDKGGRKFFLDDEDNPEEVVKGFDWEKYDNDYETGKLFKSYHGMIRALALYGSTVKDREIIFEIACTRSTSKVSSCFPCTLFMDAVGRPPTSSHLGRGDNWGIPETCSPDDKLKWYELVQNCYRRGFQQLQHVKDFKWNAAFVSQTKKDLDVNDTELIGVIPNIFLEALTFEESFTKRIIESFPKKPEGKT